MVEEKIFQEYLGFCKKQGFQSETATAVCILAMAEIAELTKK